MASASVPYPPARKTPRHRRRRPGRAANTSIDLHAHSTASDGDLTPQALVARAHARAVTTLAITDHDTVAGHHEAVAAGAEHGVRVIPGVELTLHVTHGSMHLLGYFPAPEPPELGERLAELTTSRERRAMAMVERLGHLGVPVEWDDVRRRAAHQVGRPHIADALVAAGHVSDRSEAFERWLAADKPAFVASDAIEPRAALQLVSDAGGVAVLAHPASLRLPERHLTSFVQRLTDFGLAGIEVHRPEHTLEQRDRFTRIASRFRLVPSGGSDFHRPGHAELGETGDPPVPGETIDRLFERIR